MKGTEAFSAQDFKKKGDEGRLQSVCWENGCTPHVTGEEPHAVPWGLNEAANILLRELRRMLPQPQSRTSATEGIQ